MLAKDILGGKNLIAIYLISILAQTREFEIFEELFSILLLCHNFSTSKKKQQQQLQNTVKALC